MTGRPLARGWYRRDSRDLAPDLLGKVLVVGERAGRIVEVEAYAGTDDPGSHAYRGRTPRTTTMFGPPGHLYVYFSYGMHWCANVVCGDDGVASAVLLRAVAPLAGIEAMWAARPRARRDRDLTSGPAKLCQALGIDGDDDGTDLVSGRIRILDDGTTPPDAPGVSTRIGLSAGADHPWRWFVPGDPYLSRPG
ncbi:MAG TPA: DNA-3-methyladenine glycosylase [Acidimicrobiales bacterium]|nr:DNA-3-methyladenine glycosylase [Acidimicrobiales bacterium]